MFDLHFAGIRQINECSIAEDVRPQTLEFTRAGGLAACRRCHDQHHPVPGSRRGCHGDDRLFAGALQSPVYPGGTQRGRGSEGDEEGVHT